MLKEVADIREAYESLFDSQLILLYLLVAFSFLLLSLSLLSFRLELVNRVADDLLNELEEPLVQNEASTVELLDKEGLHSEVTDGIESHDSVRVLRLACDLHKALDQLWSMGQLSHMFTYNR